MSEQEINKRIAIYMHPDCQFNRLWGGTIYLDSPNTQGGILQIMRLYTTSLDALIPVVEKLGIFISVALSPAGPFRATPSTCHPKYKYAEADSPALALATAIYKVLENDK